MPEPSRPIQEDTPLYPLLGVVGPTASGKSALAEHLARQLGGELVNCDAMQVYRGLDIGTAKPSPETRAAIPHHLVDVVEPEVFFSAGHYQTLARAALADIRTRGRIPVLAGGTGFYFRALIQGLFAGPGRDELLRARLEKIVARRGAPCLHRILERRDPASARRITPRDHQRIARALEVLSLTGRPMSEHFGESEGPLEGFRTLVFFLHPPRPELRNRIDRRVLTMLESGWLDEVRNLLARGVPPSAKGLEAIGYRELAAHLQGELSLEEAVERIQAGTRQYAKRQVTWFRKEEGLIRLEGFGDDSTLQAEALETCRRFLS